VSAVFDSLDGWLQVDIGVLLPVSISLLLLPNVILLPRLEGVEEVRSARPGVYPG